MSESDTPRTNKAKFKILSSLQSGTDDVVMAWVAEELERELAAAVAELAALRDGIAMQRKMQATPDERVAELEKDALRYRWLRSPSTGHRQIWEVVDPSSPTREVTLKCKVDLDAAIDAAMKGES